jgi:hypothetical protein
MARAERELEAMQNKPKPEEDLPGAVAEAERQARKVLGTFSFAAAMRGASGGARSPMDRVAKNTETTNKKLDEIYRETLKGKGLRLA